MIRRKIGALLLFAALLLVLAGCAQGNLSNAGNTSSLAQATQSVASEVEQTPTATQPETQPETQPSNLDPDAAPPAVVTPSSEASESPDETGASRPSAPSATPKATPESEPDKAAPAVDSIMLSIEGNAEWGTVLAAESVILAEGDTVADVLKRAAKAHRLAYEIRGSGAMTYIRGIDGLYEFDDGPTSGWKYRVNGDVPDIGGGSYKLKSGDRVEWFYTSEDDEAQEVKETAS